MGFYLQPVFVGAACLRLKDMNKMEMFLLGGMVAWTPSLLFLAVELWRAPLIDK
jgi:hypothetical protein